MRRKVMGGALVAVLGSVAGALALTQGPSPESGTASSHREAPLISEDPAADNTDVYAFRSLDASDKLTIVSNWIPAEDPAAGPMWYTFSPNARYNIYIDRDGDAVADVTYRFRFRESAGSAFLRTTVQSYSVTKIENGRAQKIASGQTPPNNVGPRFLGTNFPGKTYRQLVDESIVTLSDGTKIFAGQRDDPFFADIGAIFDLVAFRKGTGAEGGGKDFFTGYAVHSIALQVPISKLDDEDHVVGIWSTTDRPVVKVERTKVRGKTRVRVRTVWQQVSRLGNPLVNEVVIPTDLKDEFNASQPKDDAQFASYVTDPILAKLMNQLYNLGVKESGRTDLVQVFATGVPGLTFSGDTIAEVLRVNLSIAPTPKDQMNRLGVIGGDTAGYPNGRRLEDDVIDIAERAVAGALIGNSVALGDGVDSHEGAFLDVFPYAADPTSGFDNVKGSQRP